ncbi:MAG: hypothetical protein CVU54_17035 [Deltaproteobacteria bacterium HGW-Deltaproteobacteria-12]|jgi:hypothetical protein|nr:MAG: hypothetical protein CVU54_17035 [Deltaproteobacteria bacterium HGW-Deltaproteobacteria-12]
MFEKIICSISSELEGRNIPYMLIGGQAVLLYGEPRLTRDIDVTLGVDVDKIEDIISAVSRLSLKILPENIEDFVRKTMVLPAIHEDTGIRVDFIFSFSPYERQAIARAKKIRMLEQNVCIAAPEDVVIHKIVAGRPRDMEDIRGILLRTKDIDMAYIRQWLNDFSAALSDDEIRKRLDNVLLTL